MQPFKKTQRSAYLNFLRAKYEMYTGQIHVKSYPYYLGMDPCDLCQLRCPTCPTGIENESKRSKSADTLIFRNDRTRMTPSLFDALLDELGDYLFLILFYNYGEPLLNKNLPTFIKKANKLRIETEIHTNLSLPLSGQEIEDLLTSGLDHLAASIDGFSQETYQIHRVGGNLELVKSNLERLVTARERLGLKTGISYNFLVFSFNEHEIPAAQKYCQELGLDFNSRDAFMDNPEWLPSYRKQEQPWVVPKEARLREETSLGWSPLPAVNESKSPSSCAWHYGFSVVSAGGQVAPCCPVAKEKDDFGTLIPGRVSFADIWNNDLYTKSRADFAGKEIEGLKEVQTVCTRCPYPKTIHHLYSLHDAKVITQFRKVFEGSDPVLNQAFDLFCRIRYGISMHEFNQGGFPPLEQLFVGNESKTDTAKFVEFFQKNLINECSGAHRENPDRPVSLKIS